MNQKFYIDEIVSGERGNTEIERHSFDTCEDMKKYAKEARLTQDDIQECNGCNVDELCEAFQLSQVLEQVEDYLDNHPYAEGTPVEDICEEVCENLFEEDYWACDPELSKIVFDAVSNYYDDTAIEFSLDDSAEWFEQDDADADIEHANLYGGDTSYCRDCRSKLMYDDDGYTYCPNCDHVDDDLLEHMPRDLAAAKRKVGTNWQSREVNTIDWENSTYTELTPEEAYSYIKGPSARPTDVNLVWNGQLITFDLEGKQDINYVKDWGEPLYINKNGNRIYRSKQIPLKDLLKLVDKRYLIDRVPISDDKLARRQSDIETYFSRDGGWSGTEVKEYPETPAMRNAGKHVSKRYRYDEPAYYEEEIIRINQLIKDLHDRYERHAILQQDYDKLLAQYQHKRDYARKEYYDAISTSANKRAEMINAAGNADMSRSIRLYKELKSAIPDGYAKVDRYEAQLDKLSEIGGFAFERKMLADYEKKLAEAQKWVNHYKSIIENNIPDDIIQTERNLQDAKDEIASNEAQLDALMSKIRK